jgi:hypothetical protein
MSQTKTKKTFDCVAFKRKVQAEIHEEIKGLSVQEQIEYFRRAAESGPLGKWWRKTRKS